MLGRRILMSLSGAAALTLAACEMKATSTNSSSTANGTATASAMPADIGGNLYTPATAPPRATPPTTGSALADPVVLRNCQITLPQTQNVPSKNDGKIFEFCTEPGDKLPEGDDKVIHPRTGKIYRKLREGDIVKPNQLIAILDDEVASAKRDVAKAAKEAAEAKRVAAEKLVVVAFQEFKMQQDLKAKGAGTETDYRRAQAQHDQAIAGEAEAKGNQRKAEEEEKMALVVLGEHEVRATIPGMIRRFYRRTGESVKALEPVAEIQNLDLLRVEGLLDYQFLSTISTDPNLKVVVEPAPQFSPMQYLDGHLQPVLAVAVGKDLQKPVIVSASEDKTVRVWDRNTKAQIANWVHSVPVRAVACTAPTATENLCLTGADDGVPRLYDLNSLTARWRDGDRAAPEFKGRHSAQITSVAFSPDGKFCATADNKDIIVWDVSSGELKYKFPAFHKAPITYIQFTPQCELLSEARDRSMALWKLGQTGAAVRKSLDSRANTVSVLGMNPSGTRVLFDRERSLGVITFEEANDGLMDAPSEASQFTGFALFSPDDRLVLAAGTGDNPLQLWKAPQPGVRGTLIRRFSLPPGGHALCGAFSPDGTYAATGTQDGRVLVWSIPTKAETDRVLSARVTLRDSIIDSDRKARLWAILAKPEGITLPAGDTVTIVIPAAENK